MAPRNEYDAAVVGAGPNGLAAAVALAREGLSVVVLEARDTVGGGARSAELTLPGFVHDTCSAIHPLGAGSPFLGSLPLEDHGLEWVHPSLPLAHPLDETEESPFLDRSLARTAEGLGKDERSYRRLVEPFVEPWEALASEILGPLHLPRHPFLLARFGRRAARAASALARSWFRDEPARALFAGLAAHSMLPLERSPSAAIGLILAVAGHAIGWPLARGGSQRISDALASLLRRLGGEIITGKEVVTLHNLPPARTVLFDLAPRAVRSICGERLPASYARRLDRYRHGPGVFKLDWALDGAIPWRSLRAREAGTVHVGGSLEEIARSESDVWQEKLPERPFVLVAQQSLFDETRAPRGKHVAWAYCHVPSGSTADMTESIERQVERFAPGFRDLVLARHTMNTRDIERYNPNYVGGDINCGVIDLRQLLARPAPRRNPYATPDPRLFICSAATPPGGGVHGMCGFHAARAVLRALRKDRGC